MISTPTLAPDSRIVSGFPRLTRGFTESLPFAVEHRRDLWLPISLPQRWGTDIASYPGWEATTPPLASLSGISTRRRPQPNSLSIPFILVCVGVGVVHVIVVWPHSSRGKFSVIAAYAFGSIPRLRGPPHSLRVRSFGIKRSVQGPLMLLLHTASSRAWKSQNNRRGTCARQAHH